MSEIKVNSIKGVGASAAAITVNNTDGTCTANLTNRTNKNLIINGAFLVAQRGTSSVNQGYSTVDRFKTENQGVDEGPTREQVDVASGTTPYTLGFRKAFKITNGNNTSGADAGDYHEIVYKTEAQDLANSGWNYLSSSSYITLSFWVKASVAQNYYFRFQTKDGSSYNYPMETGSLSANTWTKITKTIPGASNLQIDNDNGEGPKIAWSLFKGTNWTASSVTLNQWAAYSDGTTTPDQTTTWWTTNDATFEITGVQLEVGSHATDFEHRSFAQELVLCQRYYYRITPTNLGFFGVGNIDGGSQGQILINFPTTMRVKPTSLETTGTASDYKLRVTSDVTCSGVPTIDNTSPDNAMVIPAASSHGLTDKSGAFLRANTPTCFLGFAGAEL